MQLTCTCTIVLALQGNYRGTTLTKLPQYQIFETLGAFKSVFAIKFCTGKLKIDPSFVSSLSTHFFIQFLELPNFSEKKTQNNFLFKLLCFCSKFYLLVKHIVAKKYLFLVFNDFALPHTIHYLHQLKICYRDNFGSNDMVPF